MSIRCFHSNRAATSQGRKEREKHRLLCNRGETSRPKQSTKRSSKVGLPTPTKEQGASYIGCQGQIPRSNKDQQRPLWGLHRSLLHQRQMSNLPRDQEANPPGWGKKQRLDQPWGRGSQTAHHSPNLTPEMRSPWLSIIVTLGRGVEPWGGTRVEPWGKRERPRYANEGPSVKRLYLLNEKELTQKGGIFGITKGYSIQLPSMDPQPLHIGQATISRKGLVLFLAICYVIKDISNRQRLSLPQP